MDKLNDIDFEPVFNALGESNGILVGGQSISFWANYYGIQKKINAITRDIDFYGDSDVLLDDCEKLSALFDAKAYIPDFDDQTPNSGKMACLVNGKNIEIDYLYNISGVSNDEIETFSPTMRLGSGQFRILHPLLCLESKISNLALHIGKRTPEGIEQARLSVEIVKSYLGKIVKDNPDSTFKAWEKIGRLALRESALFAEFKYGIDVLNGIPIDQYPDSKFKSTRYPQIISQTAEKRIKFSEMMQRKMEILGNDIDGARFRL